MINSGHFLWKNFDYGIWLQSSGNRQEVIDNVLIENGMGVWTFTFSPPSLSHERVLNEAYMQGGKRLTKHFLSQSIIMLDAKVYLNLILPNPLKVFCVS